MPTAKWSSERERDISRKRSEVLKHEVEIPPCADQARRTALECDDIAWLCYYFGPTSGSESPFTYAFTSQQVEMIAAIRAAILDGGDQAIAASRGEGKTSLFERMLLKYTLSGTVRFAVLFASTAQLAQDSLESIKNEIETNVHLREDYPEVCIPVLALENTPHRAHYQIVSGKRHDNGEEFREHRSKFSWCGQEVYLPNVPGSPASGSIIATRGLDSAVRGLKKKGRRVDVVGIDDPDTEDSARSESQSNKLETRIDRAIAGLGGQKRQVARIMLTTIQSRISVSFKFTDPELKPSWQPKRFKFLVTPPQRKDLWEEYVHLKRDDWRKISDGTTSNAAHEFFVAHRPDMEAGAVVANPNRYVHGELCALQHYYNQIARTSAEAVATEYDNDPPRDDGVTKAAISRQLIEGRLSGFERNELPPESSIVIGVDVGKMHCHWVAGAFRQGGAGAIVNYGIIEVTGTEGTDKKEVIERAILRALVGWKDSLAASPFRDADGNPAPLSAVLVDSGYFPDAVYEFVRQSGAPFRPTKGVGGGRFVHGQQTLKRRVGNHWHAEKLSDKGVMLYTLDADYWKRSVHERFVAQPFDDNNRVNAGSLTLFVPGGNRNHRTYSAHVMAEEWITEFIPGKGEKSRFLVHSGNNHYYDATALILAGAEMTGCGLFIKPLRRERMTLEEMRRRAATVK